MFSYSSESIKAVSRYESSTNASLDTAIMDKSKLKLLIPLLSSPYSKEPYSILSLSEGRLASPLTFMNWISFFLIITRYRLWEKKQEVRWVVSLSSKTVNKEHSAFSKSIWLKRLPNVSQSPVEKCGWQHYGHSIAQHSNPDTCSQKQFM